MTEAATCLNISAIRQQFPALRRGVKGRPAVYFDGPAGSQVPFSVADAVHQYLLNTNANRGGRSPILLEPLIPAKFVSAQT